MCLALALAAPVAHAETTVPIDLQVDLLRKVVRFERGFARRGGDHVVILLVVRGSNPSSTRAAIQLGKALEAARQIAGKPVKVALHRYTSAAGLRSAVGANAAQLVYLTPGFDAVLREIATAMAGIPAITVTTDGDQVEHGVVLGFTLVSARPKIALNLGQARRQGLDFNSDLFRLARVIR